MWQAYYEHILRAAPWLNEVWPWIESVKSLWHSIEGLVLLGGLFLISRRLRRERVKMNEVVSTLGERVETFGQFAKAARDAAESAATNVPVANGGSNWETLRSEWFDIRDRIELAIERIDHKLVRGKYIRMDRRSYWDIIVMLRDDGLIRPQAAAALINMNQRYLALRGRSANASLADLQQFRHWVREVNGSLPKLPKSKSSPPAPTTTIPVAAE